MYIFGDKKFFALGLEITERKEGKLKMFVDNVDILRYTRNSREMDYEWDLEDIVEWLEENIDTITTEDNYLIDIEGKSGVEVYNNGLKFESDDEEVFDEWFDRLQEWGFKHSWFSARSGSFLADIYFRKMDKKIEISWDNKELFENVEYNIPEGICYVDIAQFRKIIFDLVNVYRKSIKKD